VLPALWATEVGERGDLISLQEGEGEREREQVVKIEDEPHMLDKYWTTHLYKPEGHRGSPKFHP
jgi:hypothetical protein